MMGMRCLNNFDDDEEGVGRILMGNQMISRGIGCRKCDVL
jgi:hypothetical protein